MKGMYLYAVGAGEHILDLGPRGVPDGSTHVGSIFEHGLTAVVSEYDGALFDQLSRADVFGRLVIHQQVIEQVNDESTVLPARLGTILSSEDEVRMVLARFHLPLVRALQDVEGAVEVDLSAGWDTDALLAEIAREPAVAELAGSVAGGQPPESVARRVQVGMLVQEAMEKRREEYRRRIVGELVSYTRDAQPNPLLADDGVVNVALLVERSKLPKFDAAVDSLGEEFADRLAFRYVGPLPPYSFATVDVVRADPARVESSRRTLGLDAQFSMTELQAAYRQRAGEAHPDRRPGEREAPHDFAVLTSARDTLNEFIRGQWTDERAPDPGQKYDVTPETVARTVLLEINRSDSQPGASHQMTDEPHATG